MSVLYTGTVQSSFWEWNGVDKITKLSRFARLWCQCQSASVRNLQVYVNIVAAKNQQHSKPIYFIYQWYQHTLCE